MPTANAQLAPSPRGVRSCPCPTTRRDRSRGTGWASPAQFGTTATPLADCSAASAGGTTATAKTIMPLSYCEDDAGRRSWRWLHLPAPRPLYGLDRLALRPDAPVLLVEGEKTADAAAKLFPDHVAVTSSGGSNAAGKADWSPLSGRHVVIWPDHDEPGRRFAADVATAGARGRGCLCPRRRCAERMARRMGPGRRAARWRHA